VANELEITPKNYPLLMFASSKKKFKEFLLDTVENNCFDAYVEFAYRVNPEITKEVTEMAGYGLSKKKLQFMADDIGPKLLPFIPKEELLKKLTLDDWLQHMEVEELLKKLTLEERLAGLTAEDRRKLKQILDDD